MCGGSPERLARLTALLLSPAVQAEAQESPAEEPALLSPDEVAKVFADHVPEVRTFLYRGQEGVYSLDFIKRGYAEGLSAYQGSSLREHIVRHLRLVVHHGRRGGPGAAAHLRSIAEAFTDCQAVQARAIERAGLQIRGVAQGFRGLVVRLVGEYKSLAVRMLAAELGTDSDANPTHLENRLTADLGDDLGLNADDIRRARLDEHASERFEPLSMSARESALARCRHLFDGEALVKGLVAELSAFDESSPPESLSRCFLDWAAERMTRQHAVFDEETCSRMDVDDALALAVLEALFLGSTEAPVEQTRRGEPLRWLFKETPGCVPAARIQQGRNPVARGVAQPCAATPVAQSVGPPAPYAAAQAPVTAATAPAPSVPVGPGAAAAPAPPPTVLPARALPAPVGHASAPCALTPTNSQLISTDSPPRKSVCSILFF